jgi:hypothetical protein
MPDTILAISCVQERSDNILVLVVEHDLVTLCVCSAIAAIWMDDNLLLLTSKGKLL